MPRLQVKVVYATTYVNIEKQMNQALDELKEHNIRDVKVNVDWAGDEDHYVGIILYEG